MSRTSVIFTISMWCWLRIRNILVCCTSMGSHLTSGQGQPASSFCPCYCLWATWRLFTKLEVSVCVFECWIQFVMFVIIGCHRLMHIKETMSSNYKIYSVLNFTVCVTWFSFCWQLCSGISEMGAGSSTVNCKPESPVWKVWYSRYLLRFTVDRCRVKVEHSVQH